MAIEHVSVTDPHIHEPKGVAAAAANTVYVATGAGSGAWSPVTAPVIKVNDVTYGAQLSASGSGNTGWETVVWKDMLAPVGGASIPNAQAPAAANFGPAHTPQRRELSFDVNDYVFIQPFHVNHDILPGAEAYFHVHWATGGTSTGLVQWEITIMRALGHNQENFSAPEVITVEQAAHGTAWRHMVTETTTPIILIEPDELIIATLRRIAPSAGSNANPVFGLMLDLHYQSSIEGTLNKSPNFYA